MTRSPETTSRSDGSVRVTMGDETAFTGDLLIGLTPEQREAVMSPARRLLIRATAGSGKTHVLTLRSNAGSPKARSRRSGARHDLHTKGGRRLRRRSPRREFVTSVPHLPPRRADHRQSVPRRPPFEALVLEANRRRLVTALAQQLRESGDFKLEDWQLPSWNRKSAGRSARASTGLRT